MSSSDLALRGGYSPSSVAGETGQNAELGRTATSLYSVYVSSDDVIANPPVSLLALKPSGNGKVCPLIVKVPLSCSLKLN